MLRKIQHMILAKAEWIAACITMIVDKIGMSVQFIQISSELIFICTGSLSKGNRNVSMQFCIPGTYIHGKLSGK